MSVDATIAQLIVAGRFVVIETSYPATESVPRRITLGMGALAHELGRLTLSTMALEERHDL
jgi:hypothetical protein